MALNFAPYQSSPPESERAKSPPLRSPTSSPRPSQQQQPQRAALSITGASATDDPWAAARAQRLPSPSQYADNDEEDNDHTPFHPHAHNNGYTDLESGSGAPRFNDYISSSYAAPPPPYTHPRGGGGGGGGAGFETSLRLPLHVEASLAYIILPPLISIALLIFERKSDYVRFHAWQSTFVFGASVLVHVIFSWSRVISVILSIGDFALMVYLAVGAWRNSETLYRVELPVLGRIASGFVDDD